MTISDLIQYFPKSIYGCQLLTAPANSIITLNYVNVYSAFDNYFPVKLQFVIYKGIIIESGLYQANITRQDPNNECDETFTIELSNTNKLSSNDIRNLYAFIFKYFKKLYLNEL